MPRRSFQTTKRSALTSIVCLSLTMTSSIGFTSSPALPVMRPLHLEPQSQIVASTSTSTALFMATKSKSLASSSAPRLTADEETDCLRYAVEMRRIRQLEEQSALMYGNVPLLSIRAEAAGYGADLGAYEDAKHDGLMAREELVTRNMGLVHYCVSQVLQHKKNQRLNSLSRDDLVQEGAIGLAKAVDKYNPAIGGKFSTYAVYWIRASVLRCIAERDDVVRVPDHVSRAVREINKAAKRLGVDLDSNTLAWKEANEAKNLAEEAGLSDRNFQEAMKVRTRRYTGGYVAFESWMQKGENLESDVPTMGSAMEESSFLETENLRETLAKFLRPKEMEALSWRYGLLNDETLPGASPQMLANKYLADAEAELFGNVPVSKPKKKETRRAIPTKGRFGEAMSFDEIGSRMTVSAEYCRRLCHGAVAKLKQAAEEGRLEPALLV